MGVISVLVKDTNSKWSAVLIEISQGGTVFVERRGNCNYFIPKRTVDNNKEISGFIRQFPVK